jgi:hypothetical protein
MSHPTPFDYPVKNPELDEIVGWFMIGFNADPDHEYSFAVRKDNTILPELDLIGEEKKMTTMFFDYLKAPDFHHVRYLPRS